MKNADFAYKQTDAVIDQVEKELAAEYAKATDEMTEKWQAYLNKFKEQDKKQKELYKAGEISKQDYNNWRTRHIAMGKRWEAMRDTLAEDLSNVNMIARSVIKGHMPEVYAINHNWSIYKAQKDGQIHFPFTLYNRQAVERLWRENPKLLPDPVPGSKTAQKLLLDKSLAWDKKKMQSVVTQGIIQGKSIPDMAKALEEVTERDFNAAMRNARTMMTGAQNAGRYDSMVHMKELGINVRKMWLSTLDMKTRHAHRLLDGTVEEVEEPFFAEGEEILYPCDPEAAPAMVYNCRCSIRAVIEGHEGRHVTDSPKMKGLSYDDWKYKDIDDKKNHLTEIIDSKKAKMALLAQKSFPGIWYNQSVTAADYAAKKGSIEKKKEYYEQQIANGIDPAKQAEYEQYLKDLEEFEQKGKQYERLQKEVEDRNKELRDIKKQQVKSGQITANDIFSQERKDNALWFDNKAGGFRAADKYFDPPAIEVHDNATGAEHGAFYRYTQGSGPFNRPLAGYEKPYAEYGSGWEEKFYKGSGNVWIDYEGQGDNIRRLTELIEKSTYDHDIWLQSGQDEQTLEGLLGLPRGTIARMTDEQLENELVGQMFEIPQFLSTAVNEGGGSVFNSKPTKWNIFVPEGSEVLYASDRGAFGKGENEMILQRGGTYEITRAYWGIDETDYNRRKIFFDVDLHSEMGYNKFQQDPNEWTGSRVKGR